MANHSLNGVNWSSLKKFAKFYFGESNYISDAVKDKGEYFIFLKKEFYESRIEAVNNFEKKFLVNIRPVEIES